MKDWISYALIAMVVVTLMRACRGDGQGAAEAIVGFGGAAVILIFIFVIVAIIKYLFKKK